MGKGIKSIDVNPVDFPFQRHYASVSGLRMHYIDEGPADAPRLVMVHGNPTWSFYYRNLILALREDHRCIAADHIGMGLSEKPGARGYEFTLAQRVADLTGLLAQIGVTEDITLVMHDWGGMIGMAYAVRHPERIRRLVILNTAAFHLPALVRVPWQLRVARTPFLGPLLVQGVNGFCRGAIKHCVTRAPMPGNVAAAYLAPYSSWATRLAVLRFVQDIPLQPDDPGYALVSEVEAGLVKFREIPSLICWGLADFVFDERFLHEWARHLPAADVHRFDGAGHYVLEDAAAEVIPVVQRFLHEHRL